MTMKRIQLKEFTFLVPPARAFRDWRSLVLTTHPVAELPNAPMLCAVSGEPFTFEMRLSIPPAAMWDCVPTISIRSSPPSE